MNTPVNQRTVSQEMLRDLQNARIDATAAKIASSDLRLKIVSLLRAGGFIEPGELSCLIKTFKYVIFSKDKLLAAMGEEAFARLATKITPTIQEHLIIVRGDPFDVPPPPPRGVRSATSSSSEGQGQ